MTENPFVGLRAFKSEDSLYYFGRNEQTKALLGQLHANRFLAVVGGSGSGKSSLVRAGLVPILESGFLVQDRDSWQIATMNPGAAPLANLAEVLISVSGGAEEISKVAATAFEEKIRTSGVAAVIEELQSVLEARQANLLILVDQFEELFRFASNLDEREEAADFVNILLRLTGQPETGIYVVLTMRSDFIGDCDRFNGLPEAMNRSQYLVPRLTRQQRREAIAGPIRLSRGKTAPRLLDKLLNIDIDTRDDLPILQHALMRTWEKWNEGAREGDIDLEHLEAVGGIEDALNNHADEALLELDDDEQAVARRLFEALTETDSGNRKIRRPAYISEIAAITGATTERVNGVIDKLCGQGRSFLVRTKKPGRSDVLVDISHESLIRQWDRLLKWVEEEAEAAKTYRRLAESAELHDCCRADIYRGIDLELALEWQEKSKPTREWGVRYHPGYDSAIAFLAKSKQANEEKLARLSVAKKRRTWTILAAVTSAFVILAGVAFSASKQKKIAQEQNRDANYQLAKVVEGEAAAALNLVDTEGRGYQSAWLASLVTLNQQNLPKDAVFPESMGMLTRWDLADGAMSNLWTSTAGNKPLRCAYFSPDGKTIVSGSESGILTFWRHDSVEVAPQKLKEFTDQPGAIYTAVFSSDSSILATGAGKNIRLWDFANPENPKELEMIKGPAGDAPAVIREMAFAPEGKLLAVGAEDNSIRIWDLSDPSAPRNLNFAGAHDGNVYTVAFSPNGQILATGSEDKSIRLWDMTQLDATKPLVALEGHKDSVASVVFSPDGKTLISGARETTILIWDVSRPEYAFELSRIENSHTESISELALSADGKTLASASYDSSIGLWDISDPAAPKRRSILEGHFSHAFSAAFSPDGMSLLSASEDTTLRLWDITDCSSLQKSTGHTDFVNSIAISPDGYFLATGARDNTTRIWEIASQAAPSERSVLSGHKDYVYSVAISPDGKLLASGSRDHDIRLFSLAAPAAPKLIATISGDETGKTGHSNWVLTLAFSSDSNVLASGSFDKTLRLWDLTDPSQPTQAAVISDFGNLVSTIAFSSKNSTLAAGSYDKTLRLYDFSNLKAPTELAKLEGPWSVVSSVSFSPDSSQLAMGSGDNSIRLWDLSDVQAPVETSLLMQHGGPVTSVTFSSDGQTLASASADKTIRLWDLADGDSPRELAILRGHTESVSSIVFTPDGGTLYSGSRDYSIRCWNLAGPFADYRKAGNESLMFQNAYETSFEWLPYHAEGIKLIREKTLPQLPDPVPYRDPSERFFDPAQ